MQNLDLGVLDARPLPNEIVHYAGAHFHFAELIVLLVFIVVPARARKASARVTRTSGAILAMASRISASIPDSG